MSLRYVLRMKIDENQAKFAFSIARETRAEIVVGVIWHNFLETLRVENVDETFFALCSIN